MLGQCYLLPNIELTYYKFKHAIFDNGNHHSTSLMKKIILIGLSSVLCICLFFTWKYWEQHYSVYDVADNEQRYFNPFSPLHEDRSAYAAAFSFSLIQKDSVTARYFAEKLLNYRDSYNERQYEEIFSSHLEYWEYKEKILLEYALAYQITGQHDSAYACLRPLLLERTGHSDAGTKRFFELQIALKGKKAVVEEIKKGLHHTGILECYNCPEKYYTYSGFKIGITANQLEMSEKDPQKLLQNLLKQYAIQ